MVLCNGHTKLKSQFSLQGISHRHRPGRIFYLSFLVEITINTYNSFKSHINLKIKIKISTKNDLNRWLRFTRFIRLTFAWKRNSNKRRRETMDKRKKTKRFLMDILEFRKLSDITLIWKHRWFSGRMLACHAGGLGSIPGRCSICFDYFKLNSSNFSGFQNVM